MHVVEWVLRSGCLQQSAGRVGEEGGGSGGGVFEGEGGVGVWAGRREGAATAADSGRAAGVARGFAWVWTG
jgi:hypothetical protein